MALQLLLTNLCVSSLAKLLASAPEPIQKTTQETRQSRVQEVSRDRPGIIHPSLIAPKLSKTSVLGALVRLGKRSYRTLITSSTLDFRVFCRFLTHPYQERKGRVKSGQRVIPPWNPRISR